MSEWMTGSAMPPEPGGRSTAAPGETRSRLAPVTRAGWRAVFRARLLFRLPPSLRAVLRAVLRSVSGPVLGPALRAVLGPALGAARRADSRAAFRPAVQVSRSVVGSAFRVMSERLRSLWVRWALLARTRADAGMSTAEYAVGTIAACGFAALLWKVVTSAEVRSMLAALIQKALKLAA
ncbi:DUF4244 domain-containing protein [Microbispora sp. NPDC049125]|uniref:DUF4244 domain-containing protein n=1 Tax=Microbispora sp. NPDC049125 TaxID=3154929 RepID=UPI0034650CC5